MKINSMDFIFRDEDLNYEIRYYAYITLVDDQYNICIKRWNADKHDYLSLTFRTSIGNPEYLFGVINEFRKKPETYFWAINKIFSKKDIEFNDPDCSELSIINDENLTVQRIKFY